MVTIQQAPRWMTAAAVPWFLADAEGLFRHVTRRGGVVRFTMINRPCLAVHEPEVVKRILVGEDRVHYDVAMTGLRVLAELIGSKGVLTTPRGERHTQARKEIGRALHGSGLARASAIMWEEAETIVTEMKWVAVTKKSFDMAELMGLYAIRVIARSVFGMDLSPEMVRTTRDAVEEGIAILFPKMQLPILPPLRWLPRFRFHAEALDGIVETMINRRLQANDWRGGEDTMSILLCLEQDGKIDRDEVKDNLKTLFVAGHETTASALTWLWKLLAEHPDRYDWIADEAQDLAGPLPATGRVPAKRVEALINESMRLTPVAALLGREAIADHELCGERIQAGTLAFLPNLTRHHDPAIWGPDAHTVRPERFLEDPSGIRTRLLFSPFGGGDRLCLGMAFAMLEMATLVIQVSQSGVRFRLAPDAKIKIDAGMTRKLPHLHMIATYT